MVFVASRSALNERGQALVEYAVIVALIGACLVAILGLVSRATRNTYSQTASTISRQTNSAYGGTGGGGMGGGGGGGLSGSVQVIPASAGQPPDTAEGGSRDSAATSAGTQ